MSRRHASRYRNRSPGIRRLRSAASAAVSFSLLSGCGGGGGGTAKTSAAPSAASPAPTAATTLPASVTPRFVDATGLSNIDVDVVFTAHDLDEFSVGRSIAGQVAEIAIGGAAGGDFDNDGDVDIFIARGDRAPNLLYRNEGGLSFVEVAFSAGLAFTKSANENYAHSGPTFADMDGDGDLDLFLGGLWNDPSEIYRNNGDGTFTDVTQGSGIDTLVARYNVSSAFGDYDRDGDLDLFVAHWGTPLSLTEPGDTQNLWQNVSSGGEIAFRSVSVEAGIAPSIITLPDPRRVDAGNAEFTFTPTFARIDDDLFPDILSVADFNQTMVFLNNGDGTFRNATDTDVLVDDNGMGSAVGDYDNDGDLDWFVSSIYSQTPQPPPQLTPVGNRLYRNEGGGRFTDVSASARIQDGGWGWAACFLDFENDGDLDIYHTNGWQDLTGEFQSDRSRAFLQSAPGRFVERADELGLGDEEQGRGVVCADFDNDGDMDVLLLHLTGATLWKNDTSGNNYLRVRIHGFAPNTRGAGTRIYARVGTTEQMREVMVGSNFISQNPTNVVVFGLGTAGNVDELRFQWPDGTVTSRFGIAANQTYEARQPQPSP